MKNAADTRLAFVTDSIHPNFAEDDRIVVRYLSAHGYWVDPVIWDDSSVNWSSFDCIILRSSWDYFLKIVTFTAWLDQLALAKVKVYNPVPVLQWNKNKNYLLHFKEAGILIPEFEYCKQGLAYSLNNILQEHQWHKVVIKPSVSGGAHKTWVTDLSQALVHQLDFEALTLHQDVIVQKFSDEIVRHGELSLINFNKKFSHAVLKQAKVGDFRVQAQYGGQHTIYHPSASLLNQVDRILSFIADPLLYARIDGFLDDQHNFWLMELELLEPVLFFDSDTDACQRFEQALTELIAY